MLLQTVLAEHVYLLHCVTDFLNHLHHLCGFLASFDLLDSGLSQFDPVCDGLKVCTVLLHALRHPVKGKPSQKMSGEYRWIHI